MRVSNIKQEPSSKIRQNSLNLFQPEPLRARSSCESCELEERPKAKVQSPKEPSGGGQGAEGWRWTACAPWKMGGHQRQVQKLGWGATRPPLSKGFQPSQSSLCPGVACSVRITLVWIRAFSPVLSWIRLFLEIHRDAAQYRIWGCKKGEGVDIYSGYLGGFSLWRSTNSKRLL